MHTNEILPNKSRIHTQNLTIPIQN